jgi:hypothetical protein
MVATINKQFEPFCTAGLAVLRLTKGPTLTQLQMNNVDSDQT